MLAAERETRARNSFADEGMLRYWGQADAAEKRREQPRSRAYSGGGRGRASEQPKSAY